MNLVWRSDINQQSIAVPGIFIHARNREDYDKADSALANIASTEVGVNLLNQILSHSNHGKQTTVTVRGWANSKTIPMPTQNQRDSMNIYYSDGEEILSAAARPLALKGRFLKGEGTSATVYWDPNERQPTLPRHAHVTEDCHPFSSQLTLVGVDRERTFIGGTNEACLVHQLVHAMRIMKGTYTDDLSDAGKSNEERRALGVMEYANESISENAFRREITIPLRAWYPS